MSKTTRAKQQNNKGFEPSAQQQKIINAMMNQPLFVRAGAGTGKTETMVLGIVDCLKRISADERKEFFNQFFMVTFTDNAANELKTRLRSKIAEDEDPDISKLALEVDNAWISTIHGLCSRILRMYALEANIDPDFKVCEDVDRDLLLTQAKDMVAQNVSNERGFAELFGLYGLQDKSRFNQQNALDLGFQIAQKLAETSDPESVQWVTSYSTDEGRSLIINDLESLKALWQEFFNEYENFTGKLGKKPEYYEEYRRLFKKYLETIGPKTALEDCYYALLLLKWPIKTVFKDDCFQSITKIKAFRSKLLQEVLYQLVQVRLQEPLLKLAKRIKDQFDLLKQEQGFLDNNDLLEKTAQFLNNPGASEIKHSFKLCIVDEFQDTNHQQYEIIERLAKDKKALCLVGDGQQSIYRFRGADLSFYNEIYKEAKHENNVFNLTTNYRSQKDILALAKTLLDQDGIFPEYLDLETPQNLSNDARATTLANMKKSSVFAKKGEPMSVLQECTIGTKMNKGEFQNQNRSQVVEQIVSLVNEGVCGPEDVFVLTDNRNSVSDFSKALNAVHLQSIKVNQELGTSQELQAIEYFLVALANPGEVSNGVLPLLAGPIFELPLSDILLISKGSEVVHLPDFFLKNTETIKNQMGDSITLNKRTYRAFDILSSLRHMRKTHSVSELVESACIQSGWFARLDKKQDMVAFEKMANIKAAIEAIREIVDEKGYGIAEAAYLFKTWRSSKNTGRAPMLHTKGAKAVTVETVHQSKGLQYPFVVIDVALLARKAEKRPQLLMVTVHGKTYMSLKPSFPEHLNRQTFELFFPNYREKLEDPATFTSEKVKENSKFKPSSEEGAQLVTQFKEDPSKLNGSEAFEALYIINQEEELAEAWRLLYVAITRAQFGVILGSVANLEKPGEITSKFPLAKHVLTQLADQDLATFIENPYERCVDLDTFSYRLRPVINSEKTSDAAQDLLETFNEDAYCKEIAQKRAFYVFEENEKLLPKIPWNFMQDVGSFSSDENRHADEEAETTQENDVANLSYEERKTIATDILQRLDGKPVFEFGNALHELCELVANQREYPTQAQISSRVKAHHLDAQKEKRLLRAFDAWWNSSAKEEAFAKTHLIPEYPFFIEGLTEETPYTRGFIDLLAFDDHKHALVVDYKTGETKRTLEEAKEAHRSQGIYYARALLAAGFEQVSVKFVLVENLQADKSPLVVDFETYTNQNAFAEEKEPALNA